MASQDLHVALLRPAVLHILRAAGFHSARPSTVDTLTDLCARHLLLVASKTAHFTYERSSSANDHEANEPPPQTSVALPAPTLSDVRHALTSISFFTGSMTSSEEDWQEALRKPLSAYTEGAREKERQRRNEADTEDVQEFVDWATGPSAREIRRVAGLLKEKNAAPMAVAEEAGGDPDTEKADKEDYLTALKKKHSKTGDGARYAGTTLGKSAAEERPSLKIEGGPMSLAAWKDELKRKQMERASQPLPPNKKIQLSS